MRKLLFTLCAILLIPTMSGANPKRSACREYKEDDKIVLPVTPTKAYEGIIVISDYNPDPCQRIYLIFLKEAFGRPFFLHYDEVVTKAMWDEAMKWREGNR